MRLRERQFSKKFPVSLHMFVSIVIPTYNESRVLRETLNQVARIRGQFEVIVSDGGSEDDTVAIAREYEITIVTAPRGRGSQMAAGSRAARGDVLWFLHADTTPPDDAVERILEVLRDPGTVAGNFRVRFSGSALSARLLTRIHPCTHGSRLAFGDSAIFIRRSVYEAEGGFQSYPIFEDLDLVHRLLRRGRFVRVPSHVTTSSRRFENRSFLLTYCRWALLLFLYRLGVSPRTLGRYYAALR